jgi:hypothetical protein
MKKLIFLLEEQSMKELLNIILPKIIPESYSFQCIVHNGKSALQKSIPIKTRAWREPNVQFIVVHDKDSADCKKLKTDLHELIYKPRRSSSLIRIACTELESWFLGDFEAIEKAFNIDLSVQKNKALFRNPDSLANPKQELTKLVPKYQQITGSIAIAQHMDITKNKSHSFNVFVAGIQRLVAENCRSIP